MSEKVRVLQGVAGTDTVGMMDPRVGMHTHVGVIAAIEAGTGVCTMTDTSVHAHGGRQRFYPHQLLVAQSEAVAWGWPSGADCVKFGHSSVVALFGPSAVPSDRKHVSIGPDGKPRTDNY